jgi:pimeloyl-ACP methyl ester carboxylesterase
VVAKQKTKKRAAVFLMNDTRVFIHGLVSSSRGTKGLFFRARYPDMIIEDFRGPLDQRMEKLNKVTANKESLIMVGSSYGGLMAAIFAFNSQERVKKLILLAPALVSEGFEPYLQRRIDVPVIIYHGREDDVVPLAPVHAIAGRVFENLTFNMVDDDHVLSKTFQSIDWDNLL